MEGAVTTDQPLTHAELEISWIGGEMFLDLVSKSWNQEVEA